MSTSKFKIKKASNNLHYYWTLQAPNGEIIAVSETYTSKVAAQHGINSVKAWAPVADVEDTTTATLRAWH